MPKISTLPADSLPSNTDYIVVVDSESGMTKKVLLSSLFSNALIGSTGIAGIDKSLLTTDSNPYKFSVYMAANQTGIADATFTKVLFDTEVFDTNNNFASNKYTVPVSGFYQINWYLNIQSANTTGYAGIASLYKNGVEIHRTDSVVQGAVNGALIPAGNSHLVQLTAGDYLEIYGYMDVGSSTVTIIGGAIASRFSGFLVSRT